MNKTYNKFLILVGVIILIILISLGEWMVNSLSDTTFAISMWIISILSSLLISFGIINYTNLNIWLKIISIIVIMAVIIFIFGFIGLWIYGI